VSVVRDFSISLICRTCHRARRWDSGGYLLHVHAQINLLSQKSPFGFIALPKKIPWIWNDFVNSVKKTGAKPTPSTLPNSFSLRPRIVLRDAVAEGPIAFADFDQVDQHILPAHAEALVQFIGDCFVK